MQSRHDDFERRFVGEFGVRVDGDAPAIISHRQPPLRVQRHVNPTGVAGHRFIHRIVERFGEQMVHRLVVGAANIHARSAAHRLQPLQHLDVLGGVVGLGARCRFVRRFCLVHRFRLGGGRRRVRFDPEQVAGLVEFALHRACLEAM